MGIVGQLRRKVPRVKWVSEKALHLTLHFFGEVADGQLSEIFRVFDQPGLARARIPARLGNLGQFPPRGNPRVLWMGLVEDGGHLNSYWETFEKAIAPLGWQPDKRGFAPHVTIARAGSTPVDETWKTGIQVPSLDFFFQECVLFQSILSREGAEYVPLRRIAFTGGSG